jgi:hypothetical protein
MKRHLAAVAAVLILSTAPSHAATLPHTKFTIASAISVDTTNHTVTLPIHSQTIGGKTAWYIVTDASNAAVAKKYGVNFAPSIADLGSAVIVSLESRTAPDFSPTRSYVASEGGFPPKSAAPGSTAADTYSPFVRIAGSAGVVNAPIIAVGDGDFDVTTHTNTEDRVIAIDTTKKTATLVLARGFFNDKPVYYLSTEASADVPASVERATFVPLLAKAASAAEIPIGVVVNGPQTGSSPQGLAFLALRTPLEQDATAANASTIMSSFNVLSLAPDLKKPYADNTYSPLWNVMVVGAPQAKRLTRYSQISPIAKAAGFVVNCPVVAYGDDSSY